MSASYLVITPCRDEAKFAERVIQSVLRQTQPPSLWIFVDDQSSDATPQILADLAAKHSFVRVLRMENRPKRELGPAVVRAFYRGLEFVDWNQFEFLCKLDLDVELPPRYFEHLIARMRAMPRLGIASGKPYFRDRHGKLEAEVCGDEHAVGMVKFYRRRCFEQINGLAPVAMWDGIDGHRARMLGWVARSWNLPELRFEHLRPMGSSVHGLWTGRMRHGAGQYFMGTGVLYIFASAVHRFFRTPAVIGSIAIVWGYLRSALQRAPRYEDRSFRSYVRRYQLLCLLLGKRRATDLVERQRGSLWNPNSAEAKAAM